MLCLLAGGVELGQQLLHLRFLRRDAFENGSFLDASFASLGTPFGGLGKGRAVGQCAVGKIDEQPFPEGVRVAQQAQGGRRVSLIAMLRLIAREA